MPHSRTIRFIPRRKLIHKSIIALLVAALAALTFSSSVASVTTAIGVRFGLLTAGTRNAPQENTAADSELDEIQRQCDERNRALGPTLGDNKDLLAKLSELVDVSEQEAKKEPSLVTAATGLLPAEAIQQTKTARDSIKIHLEVAETMRARATEHIAIARRTNDRATKVKNYNEALRILEDSASHAQQAAMQLKPGGRSERPFVINRRPFEQAAAMFQALENQGNSARLSTLNAAFDQAATRAGDAVLAGQKTQYFSGSPQAYKNGAVTLSNSRKVDVTPIEQAAAGSGPRRPLYREVPAPEGVSRLMLDTAVYNRARAASADPKVGGVALQVTFLALEASGLQGFSGGDTLDEVDDVVLLSLQRLIAGTKPYSANAERWATLPDALRFPGGGIGRIHGFVLDPSRRDIVLVASPARRTQARLDIDSIILGLRASWRDNVTALVSLDPSPLAPFGPQLSRVAGVPPDSVTARIMLDADYMMKQIMLGKRPTDVASYRSAVDLTREDPTRLSAEWAARFWFYPKPLSPSSVAVSGSGRTATFNAELQVLTEQMATQGEAFVGEQTVALEETAAFEFTRALDAFAASANTDPDALFDRLRGVTDVVTLGALLRKADIDYPVLKQISALPHRRLAGAEAPPTSYPGVVAEFDVQTTDKRRIRISIGGGVELAPRPRLVSHEPALDRVAVYCERMVDAGELQSRDFAHQALATVFTRVESGAVDPQADAQIRRGSAAFRKGQFEAAAREFRGATDIDPGSVDAFVHLAFSFDRLGRTDEALAAIRTARLLDPGDRMAQLIEFAIQFRSKRSWLGPANPLETLRALIGLYTLNARHALNEGNPAQAYAWANDAIAFGLDPAATEAFMIRGFARMTQAPENGCEDIRRSWDETEYVLSGGSYDNDEKIHALASLGLAQCSILRMTRDLEKSDPGPALFRALGEDLGKSIELMRPVQKLFPEFPSVFVAIAQLERQRYFVLKEEYSPEQQRVESQRLATVGEDLLRRFPESAEAYSAVAELHLDLGTTDRAIAICDLWLGMHPLATDCLTVRATAFALTGRCKEARRDLSLSQRSHRFSGVPQEFQSRCGKL